jgi:hypothetical protein
MIDLSSEAAGVVENSTRVAHENVGEAVDIGYERTSVLETLDDLRSREVE